MSSLKSSWFGWIVSSFPEAEMVKPHLKKGNGSFQVIWGPRKEGVPSRGTTGMKEQRQ